MVKSSLQVVVYVNVSPSAAVADNRASMLSPSAEVLINSTIGNITFSQFRRVVRMCFVYISNSDSETVIESSVRHCYPTQKP